MSKTISFGTTLLCAMMVLTTNLSSTTAKSKWCKCLIYGDPHYRSFDGQFIEFMGKCNYILSQHREHNPCRFVIEGINTDKGTNKVSWLHSVRVKMFNHVFDLGQNKTLKVDGKVIKSKYVSEKPALRIFPSGPWIQFLADKCGLRLQWDGKQNFMIFLKRAKWAGKLNGICGDCNGNKKDDYIMSNGKEAVDKITFANSYVIGQGAGSKGDECKVKQSNEIHSLKLDCHVLFLGRVKTNEFCGLTNIENKNSLFYNCLKSNSHIQRLYKRCAFDVCTISKLPNLSYQQKIRKAKQASCEAIKQLAEYCAEKKFKLSRPWRKVLNCPKPCGPNSRYVELMSPCQPMCSSKTVGKCFKLPRREGCKCNAGYVLFGENCVQLAKCPKKEVSLNLTNFFESYTETHHSVETETVHTQEIHKIGGENPKGALGEEIGQVGRPACKIT